MSRDLDLMRQGFMRPTKPAKLTKQQKQEAKEQEARILARLDAGERRRTEQAAKAEGE